MQMQVWSRVVRITHWLVAVAVLTEWLNETGYWHRSIGYFCLSIVALRLLYSGLTSSLSARFYWPSWQQIRAHWYEIKNARHADYTGHNPWGQWAVYLMWSLIVLLALTGFISRTDAFWGEDWPVDMHKLLSNILMLLVILHVLAVGLMSYLTKRNLVRQMLTGRAAASK